MFREVIVFIITRSLLYGGAAFLVMVLLETLLEFASRHGWLPL